MSVLDIGDILSVLQSIHETPHLLGFIDPFLLYYNSGQFNIILSFQGIRLFISIEVELPSTVFANIILNGVKLDQTLMCSCTQGQNVDTSIKF